ncbi:MAG: metal-dependent hydrolase [Desulfobacterales bacterium RIFOXYA12_FULL_46_15]|nr:MAG: metal-dependent hydrolase [Desulfobacterales bacterium RIFOXYA12_FULL_46_15]
MDIKCWGSRGSIPVSGPPYIRYGGDTTCMEITAKTGETIIIDAGTGLRRLGNSLMDRNINQYHLLLTHAHWDHIMGIAFFKPLQFGKVSMIIQDRLFSGISTRDIFHEVMKKPFFPISLNDLKARLQFKKNLNKSFSIGSVKIETIPTSHNNGGLGYRFIEDGKSFVFLTDNELGFNHPESRGFDAYIDFSRDTDLLFHDGEYTKDEYPSKTGWGHSCIRDVMDLAVQARVKKLGLFHLNQDRTDDDMDKIVDDCRAELKHIQPGMDVFAVSSGMAFHI